MAGFPQWADSPADPRVSLVAQAASVREGRRLAALHDFDVLLVDLNLGDGTGFDLMTHVKTLRPFAELVVISASDDEQHALHAFELGATGYLVKNSWFGNFAQSVLQVLKLVASGYTSPEIGVRLTISHQTVNAHVKNIYRKLQVRSRAQAVSQAAVRGLL